LVSKIYMAAISREELPPRERRPFFLVVDEFQEFFTEAFMHILESGRKYKLACAAMAHQNLVQPPFNRDPAFVETILSNTHTQMIFNVSERDAQRLVGELWQFRGDRVKYQKKDIWGPIGDPRFWSIQEERENAITELTTQGTREFYLNIKGKGCDEPFIAVAPEAPDVPWRPDYEEALKQHSFKRYARPRARIEDEIRRRREAMDDAMAGGRP